MTRYTIIDGNIAESESGEYGTWHEVQAAWKLIHPIKPLTAEEAEMQSLADQGITLIPTEHSIRNLERKLAQDEQAEKIESPEYM